MYTLNAALSHHAAICTFRKLFTAPRGAGRLFYGIRPSFLLARVVGSVAKRRGITGLLMLYRYPSAV
ncbi:MAG: hypothetical protein LBI40_02600 [Treponema sp.]|nr:hypothetical protein [Treponema sp.]